MPSGSADFAHNLPPGTVRDQLATVMVSTFHEFDQSEGVAGDAGRKNSLALKPNSHTPSAKELAP